MSEPGDFQADPRRAMTPARKRRIWDSWKGVCYFCRQPVAVDGPSVIYDHVTQLWMKGSDANEAIAPIHADPCNKLKTAADATARAKVKRIWKKHDSDRPEPKRKLKTRGFDRSLRKKMDGTVERRK